jgi:hypothetical protein
MLSVISKSRYRQNSGRGNPLWLPLLADTIFRLRMHASKHAPSDRRWILGHGDPRLKPWARASCTAVQTGNPFRHPERSAAKSRDLLAVASLARRPVSNRSPDFTVRRSKTPGDCRSFPMAARSLGTRATTGGCPYLIVPPLNTGARPTRSVDTRGFGPLLQHWVPDRTSHVAG